MGESLSQQLRLFAGAMVLGNVIGLQFDLCDCLCSRRHGFRRALADGLFCLTAAGLILLFLLIHTQGVLRNYLIVGTLLGFGAEHTCLSPLLRAGFAWLLPRLRWGARQGRDAFFWLFSFPRGQ